MRIKYPILFLALMLAMLFISACSPTVTPPGTAGKSSLTPLQVLQKSTDAMKQLKSAHVELQSTSNVQTAGITTGTPSTTTTPIASNTTLNTVGTGDESLPNQEQLKLTINQGTTIAEIVQRDKVYVQNAQGKWYVLNKSSLQGAVANPFSGFNVDQNTLLALVVQHAKISDSGDQLLNGQSLRHITADLDRDGIRQLLKNNPELSGSLNLNEQNIDAILDKAKTLQSSVDVWIDETNFYVHRTEVKLNVDADTSSVSGTPTSVGVVPTGIATRFDSVIDLSKFNEPVTITPPTNATATSDPTIIFNQTGASKP